MSDEEKNLNAAVDVYYQPIEDASDDELRNLAENPRAMTENFAEEKIEEIEARIDELKDELCKPEYASMYSKLSEIQEQIDAAEAQLLETMEQWESETNS